MKTFILLSTVLVAIAGCKKEVLKKQMVYVDTSEVVVMVELVDSCYHFCSKTKQEIIGEYQKRFENQLKRYKAVVLSDENQADYVVKINKIHIIEDVSGWGELSTVSVHVDGSFIRMPCYAPLPFHSSVTGHDKVEIKREDGHTFEVTYRGASSDRVFLRSVNLSLESFRKILAVDEDCVLTPS
jgi:hypothetical protein